VRKDRKNKLLPRLDKVLLRQCSLIESVHDPLKHISQLGHVRRRSVAHFWVNLVAGLSAYISQPQKFSPHIRMSQDVSVPMVVL
jgi:DDE family transposase